MGFFSQIFGKKPDYPPLAASEPAANRLAEMQEHLERLAEEIPGSLEIVPADDAAYAFIGKPPKKFGVAWVDPEGRVHNFKTLVDEKGLSVVSLERLSDELKAAYVRSEKEQRFSARLGEHDVVVTPSPALATDISSIIEKYAS